MPPEAALKDEIVAATATPLLIVISAKALNPVPVTLVRGTPLYCNVPLDGVYPTPIVVIFKVPVAIPALPAYLPVALLPS